MEPARRPEVGGAPVRGAVTSGLWAEVAQALGAGVRSARPVAGGDVARSYRVELDDGRAVFAKTHADPPPAFFVTEATGLTWLREAEVVAVPDVLAVRDGTGPDQPGPTAFLVLEWIGEGTSRSPSSEPASGVALGLQRPGEPAFGVALAGLHRAGAPSFGREDRRPTGSRSVPNDPADTWAEFYAQRRLLPLVALARREHAVAPATLARVEDISTRLPGYGAFDEPPARLHGDLWAGNRLIDAAGVSWLIDPAAHGGHREFDLAMMRLFGGFGAEAFAAYDEAFPLAEGWERRVPLHQLAPLLVHAIKFGGSYPAAVDRAVASLV